MIPQRNLFYALLLCHTFLMYGMRTRQQSNQPDKNNAAHTMQMMEGLKAACRTNYTYELEEHLVKLQKIYCKQKDTYATNASLSSPSHTPMTLTKKDIALLPWQINKIHNTANTFNISNQYRTLSMLNLRHNNLTAFDLVPFAACPHLTAIDLSYNKISALALRSDRRSYEIVTNNHLTALNLAANEFSTIDMDRLFEAGPNIRSLDLSDNKKLYTIAVTDNPVTMWPIDEDEFELDRHKKEYPYLPTIVITNSALDVTHTQKEKLTTWYIKKLGELNTLSARHNRERGGTIAAVGIVAGMAPIGLLDNFDLIVASHPLLIALGYGTLIAGCISIPLACYCCSKYDKKERTVPIVKQKIW
jgi:hypothetical protein